MKRFRPKGFPLASALLGPGGHIDIHQHLWPGPLVDALRARRQPPRLSGWTLELANEREYVVDPADHEPAARAEQAKADGNDLVLVSLSTPLGIELLPCSESQELLAAYHEGVLNLPRPFGAWAAPCLTKIDPSAVERELARGFVGLQLPANALLDAEAYSRLAPLLDILEAGGWPMLIHPGAASPSPPAAPGWWPALVGYVQQMHAAWFAFREHGRPRHPRLRVCFAMLAGLAPLHGERLLARAGARSVIDTDAFLEISSYGTRAVDAIARVLGIDVLVNGSDRPYAAPVIPELGAAALSALRFRNPLRLLNPRSCL